MLSLHEKMKLLCGAFTTLTDRYSMLQQDMIPKSVAQTIDTLSKQIEELANEIAKAQLIQVTEIR